MGIRITAPSEFDGVQTYGEMAIPFVKGVAEVEGLPAGVELYMRGAGYQVEKGEVKAAAPASAKPAARKPAARTRKAKTPVVEPSTPAEPGDGQPAEAPVE